MRNIVTLLIFLCLGASAQTDTLILDNGKTITGVVKNNYTDRLIFKSGTTRYMVLKDRITYTTNRATYSNMNLPVYRDTKYWLRLAGIQGIVSSVLIAGGGFAAGIGAAKNKPDAVNFGLTFLSAGVTLTIPVYVFVFKAGRTNRFAVP